MFTAVPLGAQADRMDDGWVYQGHAVAWALLPLGLLAGAAACGNSTDPPVVPDINGAWAYNETTTGSDLTTGTTACSLTGTLTFVQDSMTFVGTYHRTRSCSTPGTRTVTSNESGSISRSVITDNGMTFLIRNCQYQAAIPDSLPTRLTGNSLCTETDPVTLAVHGVAGSWTADRLAQ